MLSTRPVVTLVLATLALGCTPKAEEDPDPPDGPLTTPTSVTGDTATTPDDTSTTPTPTADTDTGSMTGSTGDTALTGTTGSTADTASTLPVVDCANLPQPPLSTRGVPGARGYHGLAFTQDGRIAGSDGNLLGADAYGNTSVILPGTGSLQQLDMLSDGRIVAASSTDGAVIAVDPATGGATVLAAGLSFGLYGLRVGPDDRVYLADQDRIFRVDPSTGSSEVWLDQNNISPKVLDFNVDFTKMYIGTNYEQGKVWEVLLDANHDPIAAPTLLAETPGSWHDGLTVDVCGNIYVAEFNNRAMYRIDPSGTVRTVMDLNGAQNNFYGHGVVFGTGSDGWLADAVYVPQPYNGDTVAEVVLGVPHRSYPGPVINGP